MKKIILVSLLLIGFYVEAQNDVANAFSESYKNEINHNYQQAIQSLTSLNRDTYSINLRIGWLYYLEGDFQKSSAYYAKAIRLEPNSIEARFGMIYPVAAMQNWDDAIKIYNDILSIDAHNLKANYNLAYIYFVRKDWNNVERLLNTNVKLYPFDYDSNLLLGSTYIKNGKIKEAKVILQRALEYNPQSKDVLALLQGL